MTDSTWMECLNTFTIMTYVPENFRIWVAVTFPIEWRHSQRPVCGFCSWTRLAWGEPVPSTSTPALAAVAASRQGGEGSVYSTAEQHWISSGDWPFLVEHQPWLIWDNEDHYPAKQREERWEDHSCQGKSLIGMCSPPMPLLNMWCMYISYMHTEQQYFILGKLWGEYCF